MTHALVAVARSTKNAMEVNRGSHIANRGSFLNFYRASARVFAGFLSLAPYGDCGRAEETTHENTWYII
jgi:hypothetical protein